MLKLAQLCLRKTERERDLTSSNKGKRFVVHKVQIKKKMNKIIMMLGLGLKWFLGR